MNPPPDMQAGFPANPDGAPGEGAQQLELPAALTAPPAIARRKKPRPMLRQYELVERIKSYNPESDEAAINRAYVFSMKAHGTQQRASGETYFSHPLEVAGILTEMKMDDATIITALLHDTIEDTVATKDDVTRLFGAEIARLVEGVTKLSRIELQNEQTKQAENFRKLLLAMSEDIRVLLVKLADRLHNMRTLHHIKNPDKRRRIARETLEIYAPLAERIGIEKMQGELEELAFAELQPEAHAAIIARLEQLRSADVNLVERLETALSEKLRAGGVVPTMEGREKAPYSIWKKMQRKNITLEQLSDIMAFRVLVDSVEQCYQVLGILHGSFPVVPGRFKDYISTPKPNRYQSLHTAVIGPFGFRMEIQIRTHGMHNVAELGVAAHWVYKQGEAGKPDGEHYRWLRELLDIVEQAQRPEEFLEHTKLALFQDQVFCFSPKGDLIALPRGSTPIDFAYAVHSRVGDHCAAAKVNGRMVPLRTVLNNGDQVEIITAKTASPNPSWERLVATGKARSAIRKFIRSQQRGEYITLGRQMLQKVFVQEKRELNEKDLEPHLSKFQAQDLDDLYANVGASLQSPRDVLAAVYPGVREKPSELPVTVVGKKTKGSEEGKKKDGAPIVLQGLIPGMAVHYARCCHPLPGDRIAGIVATGRGVTIHTIDCDTLEQFQEQPEKWIDVTWGEDAGKDRMASRILVVMANKPGALGTVTTLLGKQDANILNLKFTNRTQEFFDLLLDLEVRDTKHLTNVIAVLRTSPVIIDVSRVKGR